MGRRVLQTLEMVPGSFARETRALTHPAHLERFPAAEEASNGDRLLTVVSLRLVSTSASWSLAYLVHEGRLQDRSLLDVYTRHMTDLDPHWLERLRGMGKAQSRYLWILLITMIFYGALQERVSVDTDPLKMPIVDVEISGPFVLGFGPALISFFVLAVTGTMRATRTVAGDAQPWTR